MRCTKAELFFAEEVGVLAKEFTFPLALLLQVILPGDLGVVRGVVAAVVDVVGYFVVYVVDQALGDCNGRGGGDEALGNAVDGVACLDIAELDHDVAGMPQG